MFSLSRKRWAAVPCAVAVVALVATGCSSDDSSSSDSTTVDQSVLGELNEATGEPIPIAFAWTGASAATHVEELKSANAAVGYINDHLGGINGRPIELVEVCEDQIQVAAARECANKFVQSDAVVAVTGEFANADAVASITSPSGMPYLSVSGGGQQVLSLPNTFVLGNPLAPIVGTPAAYAKENGYKKVAILAIDAPNAVQPIQFLGPMAFGNAGVEMDLVTIPPGTADATPQVQAALSNDPDMFHILGDVPFCTAVLKAMRTLNTDQATMLITQCIGGEDVASQIPGGYADMPVGVSRDLSPTQNEYQIFAATLDKYNGQGAQTAGSPWVGLVSLQRALNGMEGEINRETIATRLATMPEPQLVPLAAGLTFQCGTKPIPVTPNVCTKDGLIGVAQEDGTVVDIKPIDVSGLFTRKAS